MRHKLSLSLDEDEDLVATVYGILSDLPDYRLAFILNQELGLRLSRRNEDRKLYHKAGMILYPEYEYREKLRMINWHLTANSGGWLRLHDNEPMERTAIPLVDSLRSLNYFLWYEDDNNTELHRHIFEILKPNPYIRVIQEIQVTKTRNIENLISEY
jgi:hypothetical protein